ncbi:hypothetical protein RQP46_001172 [Phenoliferia psychrophenolica]
MSSAGGFSSYSAFDSPTEMQSSTFHFPQHHDFGSPASPRSLVFDHHETQLPPSPQSFREANSHSDYSPSPSTSLASVRTAKIAVLKTATREVLAGQNGRAPVPPLGDGWGGFDVKVPPPKMEFTRSSMDTFESGTTNFESLRGEDDATLGSPRAPGRTMAKSTSGNALASDLESESAWIARPAPPAPLVLANPGFGEIQVAMVPQVPSFPVPVKAQKERPRIPTSSASEDSTASSSSSSWRTDVDKPVTPVEADPSIRPEIDAMTRMKSILGPKMKIISPAPWDGDDSDDASLASTSTFFDQPPSLHNASRRTTPAPSIKEAPKENVKPKAPTSRARSFSVLSSRRAATAETDKETKQASDEALRGLGLGLLPDHGESPPTPPKRSVKTSKPSGIRVDPTFDFDDTSRPSSANGRKATEFGGMNLPGSSPLPTPPSSLPKSYKASRGRSPVPVLFDMITPGSALPEVPALPAVPKSAPAHLSSFSASETLLPKSSSTSSLTVKIPPINASGSLHSLASGGSMPSPTSHFSSSPLSPEFAEAPLSPGGSASATSLAGAPGYKLISLAEARQRETDRVAVAAAQRKAMLPVEHIVGRSSDVSYGAPEPRQRESSASSAAGRSSMHSTMLPASILSAAAVPAPIPLARVSTSNTIARELKSKKSGFLKRMMGDKGGVPAMPDRYDSPSESFRPLPDSYVHDANSTPGASSLAKSSPNPGGRVAFLSTPVPDPAQRLGKGNVPSLSLRPMSMAFSAGLPMDFLLEKEAILAPKLASPVVEHHPHSPFAPSFRSATTQSTIFDNDSVSLSSSAATPVTPAFSSPLIPPYSAPYSAMARSPSSSSYDGPESFAALQAQLLREQKAWKNQEWVLESQIRVLNLELDETKGFNRDRHDGSGPADEAPHGRCSECGTAKPKPPPALPVAPPEPLSLLMRPRPIQGNNHSSTGFSSGLAT